MDIMNNAAMNIHVHICLCGDSLHFTLIPRHGMAGSHNNSRVFLLKNIRLFSTMVALFYIPNSNV